MIIIAAGCTKSLPSIKFESPFGHSSWVEISDGRAVGGTTPSLSVTVKSLKKKPIWVRIIIDDLNGWNDCANSFRLAPGSSHYYVCPQTALTVGTRYRAELTVFRDQGNSKPIERIERTIELGQAADGSLVLGGPPAN
jgi:hypothetical protein